MKGNGRGMVLGWLCAAALLWAQVLFAQNQSLGWAWQNPKPQGNFYGGACFVTDKIGFAVDGEAGQILKTTDGGATWNVTWPQPDSMPGNYSLGGLYSGGPGVDFPNAQTGYAVGTFDGSWAPVGGYKKALILKTTNQGSSWFFQYLDTCAFSYLYAVDFPPGDAQTGYAVGVRYISMVTTPFILKTTNGGVNWVAQSTSATCRLFSVCFPLDAQTGYVVGGGPAGGDGNAILNTTNGGATWVTQQHLINGVEYLKVDFPVNDQTGYVAGYSPSGGDGTILKTTDGGASWGTIFYDDYKEVYTIHFTDNQTGYAPGWYRYPQDLLCEVRKTTDGGATWTSWLADRYLAMSTATFPNSQTGYVFTGYYSSTGEILKTTDAGADWFYLTSGPRGSYDMGSIDFCAADFPSGTQTGWVVGTNGNIYKTTDGGDAWKPQTSGTSTDLFGVDFVDEQTGFAVGGNSQAGGGVLLKTTDGGADWSSLNPGTGAELNDVQFVNAQTGYVVGDTFISATQGVVLKTTDGGANWSKRFVPNTGPGLYSVDFPVDAQTGYIAGGELRCQSANVGSVFKTTDGGATWTNIYAPAGSNFFAISFPTNAQTGFIGGMQATTGGYYKVVKTTDGGATWSGQLFNTSLVGTQFGRPFAVCFPTDAQTGFATGAGGSSSMMFKTTNGGTTWVPQQFTSWHHVDDIFFPVDPLTGYAVGQYGMIRKTTTGGTSFVEDERAQAPLPRLGLSLKVLPNPFTSFARVPGCEGKRFALYDIAGRKVGTYKGDRIGEGLAAGVYFLRPEDKSSRPVRIVKVR